jgi:hypothetical protein
MELLPCLVARDGEAGADIGIQLELLPESKVQGAVSLANGGCHGAFEPNLVLLQGANNNYLCHTRLF